MTCDDIRNWLLLQDSGELPEAQRLLLVQHCEACSSCRALQEELDLLHRMAASGRVKAGPSAQVMAAIHTAALQECARKPIVAPYWKVALAAAATLLLCLTGLRQVGFHGTRGETIATEIVPLSALVMGHDLEPDSLFTGETDMAILADQMLILQGMKEDSLEEVFNEVISPEDSHSTVPQWNSNAASHPEKRV